MQGQKKMVKDDINFLEYPNWVIDQKSKVTTLTLDKPNGGKYEALSPLGLPKHFDKIVLYYLLYRLYKETGLEDCEVRTSRYEIAKDVFPGIQNFGKNRYDRIMTALGRWQSISIKFDGIFYEGDGHTIRYFSVVDEVTLRKDSGELIVHFGRAYIKQLKDSKFYKLIDFEQYKKLHRTSSARLYEVLVKTFEGRTEWSINIQSLAEKITFEKREGVKNYYASDVLRHLTPAIKEINQKTDLCIDFQYNKDSGICIFKKLKKPKEKFTPAIRATDGKQNKELTLADQMAACMEEFKGLPADEQKKIRDDIKRQKMFKFMPDEEARIFTYMTNRKQSQLAE